MFAGIVKGRGSVLQASDRGGDRTLTIGFDGVPLGSIAPGDSVAVNGVCLTATACDDGSFSADVSAETLSVTTLGGLASGDRVNLESSLRLGDPIDGHLVYGHVDGIGRVIGMSEEARSMRLTIEVPGALGRYIAPKGSVAVDGVSLTVNGVEGRRFDVNVIPHTREVTTISGYAPGAPVNIEVDMIARYLERLAQRVEPGIDIETLQRHDFIDNK